MIDPSRILDAAAVLVEAEAIFAVAVVCWALGRKAAREDAANLAERAGQAELGKDIRNG